MKKTMRFLSMAALALVGAVTVGCSSDDNIIDEPQQPASKSNVVTLTTTVSLDGAAATTRALTSGGVKTFAEGEQIALVYTSGSSTAKAVSAALTASDITNEGKSATFTFTLTDPDKAQNVTYIYPAAMANSDGSINYAALNSQNGTLATLSSSLDLATSPATAWNGNNLPAVTLENQLAILALTLKDYDGANNITSTITGMTLSDGTNSYTITPSSLSTIYVAIKPTTSASINVTATSGNIDYVKSLTSKTYEASNGYPISWKMNPKDAIKGKFTIKSDGTQVYFSKSNLRYTYGSGTWSFFDHQYDYSSSNHLKNNGIVWDHFGWSSTNANSNYGVNNTKDNNDYSGSFVEWGSNTNLQSALGTGWFTLSNTEWTYLLNTRSGGTFNGNSNARYTFATINTDGTGVNGVILFPDNVTIGSSEVTTAGTLNNYSNWTTKCTTAQWTSLEAKGCVFLPAGGYGNGGTVTKPGERGDYWMHTDDNSSTAYHLYFNSTGHSISIDNNIYHGYLVRLVRTVTK